MQHHAGQGAPGSLLAVGRAARRLGHQAGVLERELGPAVAQLEVMVLAQLVVEMLDREAAVALAVQGQHLLHLVDRHPPCRRLAEASIVQAVQTGLVVAITPAAEGPLAHPQDLRRLRLAQLALLPASVDILELHHSQSLQHLRPPHRSLPLGETHPTGQIACYKNRSYRVSPTAIVRILCRERVSWPV